MARFLAYFTAYPLLGPGRHLQSETHSLQAPVLRIQSFSSGLRVSNALDLTSRPDQYSFFKVNLSVSSRKGKASRFVTKAIFESFTEKAIYVIMLSQEEAQKHGQNMVGTDQILLGLNGEGTGIAAKVLKSMGINLQDTRVEVEKIIGRGSGSVPVEIPFTPWAKHVLELSIKEAQKLGEGDAASFLENLGADHSYIRQQVIRMVWKNNEVTSRI